MLIIPGLEVSERRHSKVLQQPLVAPRGGLMLHYDDSSRDDWAVEWFADPRCTNGYTWLVLDDGRVVELADPALRTPHAGPCVTPRANSRFYGVAAATNGSVLATEPQVTAMVGICTAVLRFHRWVIRSEADVRARLRGHDEEAIWTKAYTSKRSLWGRLGRKVDPTGTRADGRKVIDVEEVARRVWDAVRGSVR
jgi:hypothetical protein